MKYFNHLLILLLITIVLTACGDYSDEGQSDVDADESIEETGTAEESEDAGTEDDTTAREEEDTEAEADSEETAQSTEEETEDTETALDIELEYHEIEGPPRELTDLEEALMRHPGEYSGDNYDLEEVLTELEMMDSEASSDEWSEAILNLIHESYYEEVEQVVRFDSTVETDVEEPKDGDPEASISPGNAHFSILLDASGSMAEQNETGTRMEEAKEAIDIFVDDLPENSTVSLRVYGHQEPDNQELSCEITDVIFEGEPEAEAIQSSLESIEPTGWTPLAGAIEESAGDVPSDATDSIVYVVSDGIETCGGDPVAAAGDLAALDIEPIINIIGFQVEDDEHQDLIDIAETGGGEFTYVGSGAELTQYWEEENQRMMQAWDDWQQAAMSEVDDEYADLMAQADETSEAIMTTSDTEYERADEVILALETEEMIEPGASSDLHNFFYDRSSEVWSYGYETGTENWTETYEASNEAWDEIYEQGNEKWTEYYNR